jgi:hypothetical protein
VSRPSTGPIRLCLALLLLLTAAAAAWPPYLPTHDGPQHVFGIHAANHLDAAERGWDRWLRPNLAPTNHGFGVIFGPLDAALPWPLALRAALAAMTLLWLASAWVFAGAVHPERRWLGVLLGGAAFQWPLYMGFFSFYVATAFGLLVLALAFARSHWDVRQRVWLAALLFVQAALHVVAAVFTGALVALLAWLRAPAGARRAELARTAALGAPASLIALALVLAGFDTLGA